MITPLVFSRDRAAQLDLLLRSLALNGGDLLGPPDVLFRSDSPDYDRGYAICMEEHPSVRFIEEYNFEGQVRRFLDGKPEAGFFVAFCDDNVLYRNLGWFIDPIAEMRADDDLLCFSLRLGANTTRCYPLERDNGPLMAKMSGGRVTWHWRVATGDYSYPASLDGHVLRMGDVLAALVVRSFGNPSQMEDALVAGLRDSPRSRMASYPLSALVGLPLNRVSMTHTGNRVAKILGCSPAEMNARYLAGERLSLATVDAARVDGAHCEFAPVWEPRETVAPISAKKRGGIAAMGR